MNFYAYDLLGGVTGATSGISVQKGYSIPVSLYCSENVDVSGNVFFTFTMTDQGYGCGSYNLYTGQTNVSSRCTSPSVVGFNVNNSISPTSSVSTGLTPVQCGNAGSSINIPFTLTFPGGGTLNGNFVCENSTTYSNMLVGNGSY